MLLDQHMRRLVYVAMLAVGQMSASELTGVLYSNESGPSGGGTGRIRILADGSVREMSYQKPFPREFASAVCNDPGAVWNVTYTRIANGGEKIQHVRCDGKADPAVHGAWTLVDRVLRLLGKRGRLPETLFAPSLRGTDRLRSMMASLQSLNLDGYEQFGAGGHCLRVASASDTGHVVVSAASDCYITSKGATVSVTFNVLGGPIVRGAAVLTDVVIRE